MRFFPIVTATCVAAVLYLLVLERDRLLAFAAGGETVETALVTEAQPDISERPPISILAQKSRAQNVDSGILLRGRTEAARHVEVRAEIPGLVISHPLRKGAFVESGQLLCALDPGTRGAALAEAKARLREAEINEKAASALAEKGFGSENVATGRQAALESAQASVERASKDIARLSIFAPFSGLLETDSAELGSLLQPGSICANVIQLDPIKLVGFVPEKDINQIKLGAPAGGRLISGQTVHGVVTFLSRSADPTTRTFRVEVEVPNADLAIRDGSTAEIFVTFKGEKAHLLPQSALTLDDSGTLGVRVVSGDTARFVPVSVVRDSAQGVWLSGLPDEVDVIVVGQEYVTDGRRVTVTYKDTDQ